MKTAAIGLALVCGACTATAQEKEKTRMLDQQTLITYHVSPDNRMDGIYTVRDVGKKNLWMRGNYTDGKRSGSWYTYDGARLQLCYNYTQDKLLQIDSALLTRADVKILNSDRDAQKDARIPLLICPVDLYLTVLCRNVSLPDGGFDKDGKMEVKITARVSETGKAVYSVRYTNKKNEAAEQPIKFMMPNDFSIAWIPARHKGKAVASEYSVNTVLNSTAAQTDEFRRFRWNY